MAAGIIAAMLPTMVTVVIPCFNAAAHLPAAVESVLAQGDIGVEIVLVDDCSTDETAEVARALAGCHSNIALVSHAVNAGPGPARNSGLRRAQSGHVCFLDADDRYLPGFFTAALRHFRENPRLSVVVAGVELVDCPHEYDDLHYAGAVNFMPSNKMLRRSTVELIGGFSEDPTFRTGMGGEDGAFFQVLMKYFTGVFEPTRYCRHYVGPNSHFSRFVRRTRVEDGKLVFVELEPIEKSGALTAAILRFEQQFLRRCAALRDSSVFPELTKPGFKPGLRAPA
jgi:glycosyltransferase involved in cell wall biosynthesis